MDADRARTRDPLLWALCWLVVIGTIVIDAAQLGADTLPTPSSSFSPSSTFGVWLNI